MVQAAVDQVYEGQPCVDSSLLTHLPNDLSKQIGCWGSTPGLMFDKENLHRTIKLEEDNMVAVMTGGQGAYRAAVTPIRTARTSTGKMYWEVAIDQSKSFALSVGVCRPQLQASGLQPSFGETSDGWLFTCCDAKITNSGNRRPYGTSEWKRGDRVGVLLDMDAEGGSIQFLKNGKSMGGQPIAFQGVISSGSLCGVVEMLHNEDRVRLIATEVPEGFAS